MRHDVGGVRVIADEKHWPSPLFMGTVHVGAVFPRTFLRNRSMHRRILEEHHHFGDKEIPLPLASASASASANPPVSTNNTSGESGES